MFLLILVWSVATQPAAALSLGSHLKLQESYSAESKSNIPQAIEKMVALYKTEPKDYFVNLRLGRLFFEDKKYKNSIDHYTNASNLRPQSLEPLLGLSLIHITIGDWHKTLHTCHAILKRDPENFLGQQRMVQAYLKLKHFPHAIQVATEALKSYPTDPVFLEQKGYALKEQGKLDEAKAVLTELLMVSPRNEYARSVLGQE